MWPRADVLPGADVCSQLFQRTWRARPVLPGVRRWDLDHTLVFIYYSPNTTTAIALGLFGTLNSHCADAGSDCWLMFFAVGHWGTPSLFAIRSWDQSSGNQLDQLEVRCTEMGVTAAAAATPWAGNCSTELFVRHGLPSVMYISMAFGQQLYDIYETKQSRNIPDKHCCWF